MDALSLIGLRPEQVEYIRARDHLCDTMDYNVTFERATKITWCDRAHIHISGTASIDAKGNVLYPGDIIGQTHRTMENVQALLENSPATLNDLMYLMVYLRDPCDLAAAKDALNPFVGQSPVLFLHAPVCRPEWLIEVEGLAAVRADRPELSVF
jgi:enamine deaminase RidA (YjgF/YER057c/UK114 family)